MTRVLLVTNDFPPRRGIHPTSSGSWFDSPPPVSTRSPCTPAWKGAEDYDRAAPCGSCGTRHADAARTGVERRMHDLITAEDIEAVWFGAPRRWRCWPAGPAGPGAPDPGQHARSRGGLSMLPVARSALRGIGDTTDW